MQHNLLPREKKKELRREYIKRTLNVALVLLTATTLVGAVTLFPAYIQVKADLEEVTLLRDREAQEQGAAELQGAETALSETAEVLGALWEKIYERSVTDTVTQILSSRPTGVSVNGISFERGSGTFVVEGVASTRDALVTYRRSLESLEGVGDVASPIENLARNANLPFQLSFAIASATTTPNE